MDHKSDFITEQFRHLDEKHPFHVIQNVYDKYSESSRPVKLSQIKRAYLTSGKRDDLYEEHVQKLVKLYPSYKNELDLFQSYNPWDQQKIQAKIRKGDSFYNPEVDKLVVSIPVVPEHVSKLTITKEDSKIRRRKAAQQLQKKHEKSQSVNVASLFRSMIPMLDSDEASEYIPAVLLVTGRRVNELANKGSLSRSRSGEWYACFSGQSKTGADLSRPAYEIPLLAKYPKVISSWKKSRDYLNPKGIDLTSKQLANKTRYILNHIKRYPSKYGEAKNIHNFRAIYAAICTDIYDRGNISRIAYVSHILGENSINPALHYSSINLTHMRKPWHSDIDWNIKKPIDKKIAESLEELRNTDIKPNQTNLAKKIYLHRSKLTDFWKRNKNQLRKLKKP